MKKLFRKIMAMLLAVLMVSGNGTVCIDAISDQGSDNLNNKVSSFSVKDANDNDIQNHQVQAGTSYKLNINFTENDTGEFSTKEMSYAIPEGMTLKLDQDPSYFDMTVKDLNGSTENITIHNNTYTIRDGKIVVNWNQDELSKLRGTINAQFSIHANAVFASNDKGYDIDGDGQTDITVNNDHNVNVWKNGSYDVSRKQMHYTVYATSYGQNTNVNVTDTVTGSLLSLNPNTWNMTITRNGKPAGDLSASLNSDGKEFTSVIGSMSNNDQIVYDYYADIDWSNIGTGQNLKADQTGNKVTVQPERKDTPATSNSTVDHIDYSTITKTAGTPGDANESGIRVVPWTIEINKEQGKDLSNTTLSDAISEASQSFTSYSGDGITIQEIGQDGSLIGDPVTVKWNELTAFNQNSGWSYTFPENTGNRGFRITYATDVNASGFKVPTTVSNKTSTDSTERSATGTVNVKPSNTELKLTKEATETNWESVKWRYTITVPKTGTDRAVVTDTLPSVYYNNDWLRDTLKGASISDIKVVGTIDGETYSIVLKDDKDQKTDSLSNAVKFEITFKHGENEGFAASGEDRNIVVSYESNNNHDWLNSVENGTNNQKTHRNNVSLDYGSGTTLDAHADAIPARTSISKAVSHFSGDSIYSEVSDGKENTVRFPIWKFAVTLQGVHSDSIEIKDTYDDNLKGFVKVADDNDLKQMYHNGHHAAFLYYGDYAPNDQWPEATNIDVRNNIKENTDGTGFTFGLSNIPKKDNGGYYNYYTLFYALIPKDYASYKKIESKAATSDNSELKMKNTATWNSMSSSADFSYTYPNVQKTIAYYKAGTDKKPSNETTNDSGVLTPENNKVKFTLNVNPDSQDIVPDKDTYAMTDTFTSGNISPDVDTISIMEGSKEITNQCKYDLKQDGSGIVFTLPDSKALTITYDAHITSNGSGEYANKIVNTAEIKGYTSSTNGSSRINWNAEGGSETVSAVIRKSVYGNLRNTISGAEYTLYDGDGSKGYDGVKVSGPFATGTDGKATITGKEHNDSKGYDSLLLNHMYYLMETKAPEGYQKDTTPHVFQLVKDPSRNLPNQITVGTEILLTDRVENFRIIKNGSDNKPLAGATFTLSGGDLKENQVVTTGDDGVASFSGLTAGKSYILTETSAPEGYDVSGPWTVSLDDNLVPTAENEKLKFEASETKGVKAYTATVTDKKTPISISGNKVWKDDGVERPSSVTLELQKLDKASGKYDKVEDKNVGPGTDNNWSYTFDNLDPDETYRVIEINTDKNYQSSIGTKENNWQVVNTKTGTIDIPVKKIWVNGASAAHVTLVRRLHGEDDSVWKTVNDQIVLTTGENAEYTFKNLPLYDSNGTKYEYSVKEAPLTGYKLPEITGNQETGFTITNVKLETSAFVNATKVLVGRTLSAGEFTFSLSEKNSDYTTAKENGTNITAVNQADGSVHFNALNYTYTQNSGQPDNELTDDHYYVLLEVNSKEKNITYDRNTYHIHIHNEYDASARKMKSSVEYLSTTDNGATWTPIDSSNVRFTNTYIPTSTKANLQANKIVVGREDVKRLFTLKLESLEGAPMPEGANGLEKDATVSTGQVNFGDITYTQAGTYRYRISEAIPDASDKNGYQYDRSVYLATVKVTDQEGQLNADVSYKNTNGTDTEKDDKTVTIPTFTNQFSYTPVQAKLKVTKGFTDRAKAALDTSGQKFSFTLRSDNKTIETKEITATTANTEPTITFDQLSFNKPGTYTATVFENDLTDEQKNAGWIKDGRSYTVTFNVTENIEEETGAETGSLRIDSAKVNETNLSVDNNGYYVISGSGSQNETFVNDFNQGTTTEYLHISKYVSGYPDGVANNDTFSFNIKAEKRNGNNWEAITDSALSGTDITGVTNNGDGNYVVSGIKAGTAWTSKALTFNEAGDYRYTITEVKGEKSYYTYSDDKYVVNINVSAGADNKLTHTTTYTRDKGTDTSGDYYQDGDKIGVAQFINQYKVTPITIYPAVWKTMVNDTALKKAQSDKNVKFTFTLTGNDENPRKKYDSKFKMKAVVNNAQLSTNSGKKYVRFRKVNDDGSLSNEEGITFEKSFGSHNVYTFNVTEDDPGKPYTRDDSVYQAMFDIEDDGNGNQSIKQMRITRNGATVYNADHDQLSNIAVSDYADVAIPGANSKLSSVDETNDVKKHIRQNSDNSYEADVRFTDDYVPQTTSAEISVTKILKGYPDNGLNSYSFNFQLKGTEGNQKYGNNFSDIETVIVGNVNGKNKKTGSVKFMSDATASNTEFVFDQTGVYEFTIDELYTDDLENLKSTDYQNYTSFTGITKDKDSSTIHVFVDVRNNGDKLQSYVYYTRDENLIKFVHDNKHMPNWQENHYTYLNPYQTLDGMDENGQTASFHNTYQATAATTADFPMHKGFTINGNPISTNPSAAGKDFLFRVTPMGDATKLSYAAVCDSEKGCKWNRDDQTLIFKDHILTADDIQNLKKKYPGNTDWKLDASDQTSRDLQAGDEQLDGRTDNNLPRRSTDKQNQKTKLAQGVYFKTPEFTEPGTYIYKIDEVDSKDANYTTDPVYYYATFVVTDDGTGALHAVEQHTSSNNLESKSTSTSIRFHNEYRPKATSAKIKVKKTIQDQNGNVLPDSEFSEIVKQNLPFTFRLTGADENVDPAYHNAYTRTLTVHGNEKGEIDLPISYVPTIKNPKNESGEYYNHYTFNLKEEPGNLSGFDYDQRQYKVEFDVKDDKGSLVAYNYQYHLVNDPDSSGKDPAEFVNTYTVNQTAVAISGTKQFTDNMPEGKADGLTFGFTMKAVGSTDGSSIPADGLHANSVIGQNGNMFKFDPITYTRAGTYQYKITEDDLPKDDPRYENLRKSSVVHHAIVTVKDDGAGNLTASTVVDNMLVSNDGNTSSVSIVNTYVPDTTSIPVRKVWSDQNNLNGKRPSSITVQLVQTVDGKTSDAEGKTLILSEENQWQGTFENLPSGKNVTYSVRELDYENSDAYQKVKITKDDDGGFTLTNKAKSGTLVFRKMIRGSSIPDRRRNTLNFTIVNKETGRTAASVNFADLEHAVNSKEGEYVLKDLPVGEYTVTETNPEIDGYDVKATIQVNDQKEEVKPDQVTDDISVSEDNRDDQSAQILITDTYTEKTGSVSLTKKVTGSGDKNRAFHFSVKLDNDQINGKYGDLTFRNGVAETTLKDGQTVKADNLPAGVHYEVSEKEADQDGYVTSSENASGEIREGQNIAVLFTNDKPDGKHSSPKKTHQTSGPKTEYKKPEVKKDVTPDTSDHTNVGGWTSLMIAGMAVAVITFITRRKYSR